MFIRRLKPSQKPLKEPNYFHCAPKTGSTSLYYILNRHKDVCIARGKEPNFYSQDDRYLAGGDSFWADRFSHYHGELIAGDFSTSYMRSAHFEQSLTHIFSTRLPRNTFFSTCVRHPLMWHWSHYLHRVRNVDQFRLLDPVSGTFQNYLEEGFANHELETFERQLKKLKQIYSGLLARRKLLILIYEQDVASDISLAYVKVCKLLSIDPASFVPFKGITSSERVESEGTVSEWKGLGTFANVRANRAYLPAVYRAVSNGQSLNGIHFSIGDIVIERDATHITVIEKPDAATVDKYLNYYERVSTEISSGELADLSNRFFQGSIHNLKTLLDQDICEWDISNLILPVVEKIVPSYL